MAQDPYDISDDGTPKDPKAYQAALRADSEKMTMLDEDPDTKGIVLGDDMHAFQELIRGAYQVHAGPRSLLRALCVTAGADITDKVP
jgi:hypothetical protein